MRILVLNYEFPPVGGGGGRACADLCKELAGRGHELHVLTSRARGLDMEEPRDGYMISRVPTGRRSFFRASFLTMLGYVLLGILPGLRLIRRMKPDIIHVHFAVPTGALAWVLSKLTGIPYVLTVHLGDVPGGVPQKTDRWFRIVAPFIPPIWERASRVVAVSKFTRQLASAHYDVPVSIIPNGVVIQSDIAVNPPSQPPILIFAGRFQHQKNLPFLIRALSLIQDLPWTLKLIGEGPERLLIEEAVTQEELETRIEFNGWMESEEVEDELLASDILVMPSLSEGLPIVGVQALAKGLAIVANRAGGLEDIVQEGVNGRLCQIGDQDCFVEALRWALEDLDRLSTMKFASKEMSNRFDIRRVADEYEELFLSIDA
jgi:glycosyltransferase involved in cell wall biosynthesis